jgi:hypothetical protein
MAVGVAQGKSVFCTSRHHAASAVLDGASGNDIWRVPVHGEAGEPVSVLLVRLRLGSGGARG